MEKCTLLSDGDKLKAIRIKYNLKQDEISGTDITRNLISEIETNKANITKKTAEIIIKNLTEIGRKKNFKVSETVDYLMENQIVQATKVLDSYVEELKTLVISKDGSFTEILKKAESFLIDWDIKDKKLKIYELAGDYYCNNSEMYKSAVYYEKALALINRMFLDRELIPLSRKLSMVYGYMGNYEKSIESCEFILNRFEDISTKDKIIFLYNNALSYININNFKTALYNLELAYKLVDKENVATRIKLLNNKAVCFYEMKNYDESLEIFNKILILIDKGDIEKYIINLINIANIYMDTNMPDKVNENLSIIIKELPNLNNNSLCIANIYFDIGKLFKQLNKIELAEDFCLKALNFSKNQKNYVLANDILSILIDIYTLLNNIEKMESIKEEVLSIATKQEKINNVLMFKLIVVYNEINKAESTEIANFALNFK